MSSDIPRRPLGKTGLIVPELGMGAMDTPWSPERVETVRLALDLGIQLIDTARDYSGSELLLGEVLRERPKAGVLLASKTFKRTANGAQWEIDRSLVALGVESIALYQLHDVRTESDWQQVMAPEGALDGLKAARERGLIRHIGLSTHNLEIAREAILCGEFETIMLDYSAFYTDAAPLIDLASEHEVGVIVMRPLGGSGRTSVMRRRLAEGYNGLLTPANLLRYVLSNPGVSVAIPGMSYPSRVRENVETVAGYEPMDEPVMRALEREAAELY